MKIITNNILIEIEKRYWNFIKVGENINEATLRMARDICTRHKTKYKTDLTFHKSEYTDKENMDKLIELISDYKKVIKVL